MSKITQFFDIMNMNNTLEKRFQFLLALGTVIGWDDIPSEQMDIFLSACADDPTLREHFAIFSKNGFRMKMPNFFRDTEEIAIQIPLPPIPCPTLPQLRKKFSWIKESDGIEYDISSMEPTTLKLGTVLMLNETEGIKGVEYEWRLTPNIHLCLGYQHAVWLAEHQDEFPSLVQFLGKIYIDFPGIVVVSAEGDRRTFALNGLEDRWVVYCHPIRDGLRQTGRIAYS
ncbi:MAG: hypothetical protein NUV53_04110 [Patescibacteria group bacterium]|nr:hypothetical protein [Patescibacteria group bacterium]